jgi:hypothetical protein
MKVRVTKAESWHRGLVGTVFNVEPMAHPRVAGHVLIKDADSRWNDYGLYGTDYEVVEEAPTMKIVEHDGIEYEVPSFATALTRDGVASFVFWWEKAPTWTKEYGYMNEPSDRTNRHDIASVYVAPMPEGSFMVSI